MEHVAQTDVSKDSSNLKWRIGSSVEASENHCHRPVVSRPFETPVVAPGFSTVNASQRPKALKSLISALMACGCQLRGGAACLAGEHNYSCATARGWRTWLGEADLTGVSVQMVRALSHWCRAQSVRAESLSSRDGGPPLIEGECLGATGGILDSQNPSAAGVCRALDDV
jgi:hypothetical protein